MSDTILIQSATKRLWRLHPSCRGVPRWRPKQGRHEEAVSKVFMKTKSCHGESGVAPTSHVRVCEATRGQDLEYGSPCYFCGLLAPNLGTSCAFGARRQRPPGQPQ